MKNRLSRIPDQIQEISLYWRDQQVQQYQIGQFIDALFCSEHSRLKMVRITQGLLQTYINTQEIHNRAKSVTHLSFDGILLSEGALVYFNMIFPN